MFNLLSAFSIILFEHPFDLHTNFFFLLTIAKLLGQRTISQLRLLDKELKVLHTDQEWVAPRLESLYKAEVKNVLLATLDNKDNLNFFI